MRPKINIFLFLFLIIFSRARVHSQEFNTPTPAATLALTSTPTPSPTPGKISLGGKFGLGAADISGVGLGPSIRYWLSDRTAVDIFGSENLEEDGLYSFGLGLKTNLSSPSRNMFVQGIIQASYSQTYYLAYYFLTGGASYDIRLGLGFEAFLPFCDWLSFEDSILADFSLRPSSLGQTWGIFAPEESLEFLNFSVHAYF